MALQVMTAIVMLACFVENVDTQRDYSHNFIYYWTLHYVYRKGENCIQAWVTQSCVPSAIEVNKCPDQPLTTHQNNLWLKKVLRPFDAGFERHSIKPQFRSGWLCCVSVPLQGSAAGSVSIFHSQCLSHSFFFSDLTSLTWVHSEAMILG